MSSSQLAVAPKWQIFSICNISSLLKTRNITFRIEGISPLALAPAEDQCADVAISNKTQGNEIGDDFLSVSWLLFAFPELWNPLCSQHLGLAHDVNNRLSSASGQRSSICIGYLCPHAAVFAAVLDDPYLGRSLTLPSLYLLTNTAPIVKGRSICFSA
jgi:hypothetical protein